MSEVEVKVGPSLWRRFVDNGYRVPQNIYMEGWELNALQAEQERRHGDPEFVPIGIEPEDVWKRVRLRELKAAIERYLDASLPVDPVWIDEYNRLYKEVGPKEDKR